MECLQQCPAGFVGMYENSSICHACKYSCSGYNVIWSVFITGFLSREWKANRSCGDSRRDIELNFFP